MSFQLYVSLIRIQADRSNFRVQIHSTPAHHSAPRCVGSEPIAWSWSPHAVEPWWQTNQRVDLRSQCSCAQLRTNLESGMTKASWIAQITFLLVRGHERVISEHMKIHLPALFRVSSWEIVILIHIPFSVVSAMWIKRVDITNQKYSPALTRNGLHDVVKLTDQILYRSVSHQLGSIPLCFEVLISNSHSNACSIVP